MRQIRARSGRATVTVKIEGDLVTLSVERRRGLSAEAAGHLFEKFFRVRNSSTHAKRERYRLFTVKNIAELHGGQAWRNPNRALGGFHLSFPAKPPPSREWLFCCFSAIRNSSGSYQKALRGIHARE